MLRRTSKHLLEGLLGWKPLRPLFGRSEHDGLLILAYHNVVSADGAEYGDASLHLPLDRFAEHCAMLEEEAEVVALGAPPVRGARPRVAITFDDAYAGALKNALPLLARRRWPATVFVSPGLLGAKSFWWDALRRSGRRGLPADFRQRAMFECGGRDDEVRRCAATLGFEVVEPPAEALSSTEAQLEEALRENPHLSLGAHTWSHVCLTAVPADEAKREIRASLEWLQRFGARAIPHLAYPYGEHSAEVGVIAQAAGSARSYRVDGGWSRPSDPGQAVSRLNVPSGLSAAGLSLRLHGILADR